MMKFNNESRTLNEAIGMSEKDRKALNEALFAAIASPTTASTSGVWEMALSLLRKPSEAQILMVGFLTGCMVGEGRAKREALTSTLPAKIRELIKAETGQDVEVVAGDRDTVEQRMEQLKVKKLHA